MIFFHDGDGLSVYDLHIPKIHFRCGTSQTQHLSDSIAIILATRGSMASSLYESPILALVPGHSNFQLPEEMRKSRLAVSHDPARSPKRIL